LDESVRKRLKSFGAKPQDLDSILPPTSDIDWDKFNYRKYLYRLLIKIKAKSLFGLDAVDYTPSPLKEQEPSEVPDFA
jgi:hypothetical protein